MPWKHRRWSRLPKREERLSQASSSHQFWFASGIVVLNKVSKATHRHSLTQYRSSSTMVVLGRYIYYLYTSKPFKVMHNKNFAVKSFLLVGPAMIFNMLFSKHTDLSRIFFSCKINLGWKKSCLFQLSYILLNFIGHENWVIFFFWPD